MVKLKAHNPSKIKLKSSGYMGEPTGEIEIIENGNYNVKPYATAKVSIPPPSGQAPLITENGTYDIYDYATAEVNVQPDLIQKKISQNGTYIASSDEVDGYSAVIVDVPTDLISKTITENGVYNASSDNADGYSVVTVSIPTTQGVLYGN